MICQSICFSRRYLPCSFSCCWSHKLTLYLVVFKIIILIFFSNAVGDATSRQTNAAGGAVGHAFPRRKKTAQGLSVSFHIVRTQIYVSQCEMRHSNPVPQHGFFFGALSRFFSLCSSLMFRLFASALSRSLLCRTSLLRRLFSRSISICLSLLSMFVDLFIN